MKRGSHFRQDFRATMLFPRNFAKAGGFEQAAELAGENRGLCSHVIVKKIILGVMQVGDGADDFIEDHQRRSHERARLEWLQRGQDGGGHLMLDDNGAPPAHGVDGDCALLRQQANAGEALGQLPVSIFGNQFVAGMPPPEIDAGTLEEFPGGFAEKLDQSGRVGALCGLGGDLKQQLLESLVRIDVNRRGRRLSVRGFQSVTDGRNGIFEILTSD